MNVNFEYSKTLAGEGSILLLLSLVPYVGWVLGIVGIVLLLKGMKELSNYYQDEKIYQNSLTGVKYYIVALIAAAVAIRRSDRRCIRNRPIYRRPCVHSRLRSRLNSILSGACRRIRVLCLAASHLRKTFNTLAQKTGEASFSHRRHLLWWVAILTIIRCRLDTDIHLMDICHNRLLQHEIPTIPTIHPTTKRLHCTTNNTATATKANPTQQQPTTSIRRGYLMTEPIEAQTGSDWQTVHKKTLGSIRGLYSSSCIGVCRRSLRLCLVHRKRAINRSSPNNTGFVDNEQRSVVYPACHLLGACPNRNPSSHRRNSRLAMVEKNTRSKKKPIQPLWQRLTQLKSRRSNLAIAVHRIRHQSLC